MRPCIKNYLELIIIGVKKNLAIPIVFPKEQNYTVSVREALLNVPPSLGQKYTDSKRAIMELVPEGGYWRDLPLDLQKAYMGAKFLLKWGKNWYGKKTSFG